MSLKSKLEAVIYAAEEPVTLAQLAALFAGDALEWKAAQQAAAAEQTAEVAGVSPLSTETLPLIAQGLEYLGFEDGDSVTIDAVPATEAREPATETGDVPADTETENQNRAQEEPSFVPAVLVGNDPAYPVIVIQEEATPSADGNTSPAENAESSPEDAEAQSKRLARQRDREIKAVLKQLLDELIASYSTDGRGIEIREIAGGYRMSTKPECHDAVRLFVKSLKPPLKLSLPALETLAVVAYKQPVTAPEVSEIRGVESGGVLGSLLARKLIATAGRKQVIGRPILYKTTKEFLLRFGLKDVAELPSMEEFEKMAATELDIEPEAPESAAAPESPDTPEDLGANNAIDSTSADAEPDLETNSPSGLELAEASEMAVEGEALDPEKSSAEVPGNENSLPGAAEVPTPSEPAADGPSQGDSERPHNNEPDVNRSEETEAYPHAQENQEAGRH